MSIEVWGQWLFMAEDTRKVTSLPRVLQFSYSYHCSLVWTRCSSSSCYLSSCWFGRRVSEEDRSDYIFTVEVSNAKWLLQSWLSSCWHWLNTQWGQNGQYLIALRCYTTETGTSWNIFAAESVQNHCSSCQSCFPTRNNSG